MLAYNLNYATGTVRIYGDYAVSGSTFNLNYASHLYASTATTPVLMWGSGHTITSVVTYDTGTLSQLITVENTGGNNWQVSGSSSGIIGT